MSLTLYAISSCRDFAHGDARSANRVTMPRLCLIHSLYAPRVAFLSIDSNDRKQFFAFSCATSYRKTGRKEGRQYFSIFSAKLKRVFRIYFGKGEKGRGIENFSTAWLWRERFGRERKRDGLVD